MSYPELPPSHPALEESILRVWEEEDTFHESLRAREGRPEFVFYEGPPTANGRPGVHHIISRAIKDLVARYRTMTGHHVTRIAGWDTHGLPVELEAERQLGISGKAQIEELGIAEFNRVCRDGIFTYKDDWERLSQRIGYWLDYDDAYVTCTPDYVESVWWAIAEIERKGLLYRGYKVVPYCSRCGTGLSSHEVAMGWADVVDTSVFVKFHLVDDPDGARVLSWTTTPWTLPGNVALAVGEEIRYVKVRIAPEAGSAAAAGGAGAAEGTGATEGAAARPGEVLILARSLMERTLRHEVEVLEEMSGRELVGRRYEPLFPGAVDAHGAQNAWTILPADFVTMDEGTGVVHTAVMYGEDDFRLGAETGLPMQHTVDGEGRFVARVPGGLAGGYVKDPDVERRILEWLSDHDLLYRSERYPHSYPHCWRCDSALLYMARDAWYARTTAVKDRLIELNAAIDWHPPEIGSGRMGEWLANNVDWSLSRDRYWGTPLPIWVCDGDEEHRAVLGSFAELAERAGPLPEPLDPHRPAMDAFEWACPEAGCEGRMRRVPQVLDAWFDSGSMPYAQWHFPFENEEAFRIHFPAHFIAEGLDQTRGWFYSLLALSTLLFDEASYRAVVVNGMILDQDGQKMSKSRGNVVDPWDAIGRHGADALRFYLMSVSSPGLPKRWDPDGIGEVERKLFDTLRNTYRFFALYAGLEDWTHEDPGSRPVSERSVMDRWLLSRLDTLTAEVREELERYELTRAARRLSAFVLDELSNWYVRRSRDRFWATQPDEETKQVARDAFATLHEALAAVAALLAPFAPFFSDWLYRALLGESVHLADYPVPAGRVDEPLEQEMEDVRELAVLGRAAREEESLRVRQPLGLLQAVVPSGRRPSNPVLSLLSEELNVKKVEFLSGSDDIVRLVVKPNFGRLGPRFGPSTPEVARRVQDLDPDRARRLRAGESIELELDGGSVAIAPDEVAITEVASGELVVKTDGGYLVALDRTLTPELRAEGIAREIVNRVQRLRRDAGLQVSDRIRLEVRGTADVESAARVHRGYIAGETLAVEVRAGEEGDWDGEWQESEIDGDRVRIRLIRAR
ncbi:MAG: isoleucine--tRNA ligase [Gemmatimonadota bacterium]|nr:MAG: isoleucine--tRNA ligase [Gemmatimonadota bacterium]